jgi:hypothetical protein
MARHKAVPDGPCRAGLSLMARLFTTARETHDRAACAVPAVQCGRTFDIRARAQHCGFRRVALLDIAQHDAQAMLFGQHGDRFAHDGRGLLALRTASLTRATPVVWCRPPCRWAGDPRSTLRACGAARSFMSALLTRMRWSQV